MNPPRKISEVGLYKPVWREINRVIDYITAITLKGGRGIQFTTSVNGTTAVVEAAGSGGAVIRAFQIQSIENDFYTCLAWNGTTTEGEEVYIARPPEHMVSNWHGRSIQYQSDGDNFTATYAQISATKRTKTVNGTAEVQILTPLFSHSPKPIIYAVEVSGVITAGDSNEPVTDPNDEPITLIDKNLEGRAWTKN